MQEIIKGKIYLGSKKDYLENSFMESDWSFVHIGDTLFDENKKKDLKVFYTF